MWKKIIFKIFFLCNHEKPIKFTFQVTLFVKPNLVNRFIDLSFNLKPLHGQIVLPFSNNDLFILF